MKVLLNTNNLNIRQANGKIKTTSPLVSPVSFEAKIPTEIPKSKFFEPLKKAWKVIIKPFSIASDKAADKIAIGYGKLLHVSAIKKAIIKTKNSNVDIVKHLTAGIALIISGMYIKQTLSNDKMKKKQRTTLAINQGIVAATATVLGYSFDRAAGKRIAAFTDKFMLANEIKNLEVIATYKEGIKVASSLMIFGMMYRFIAPVLVTPIANAIGNRIQKNKKAELVAVQKASEKKA